jgi:hypothetical protein
MKRDIHDTIESKADELLATIGREEVTLEILKANGIEIFLELSFPSETEVLISDVPDIPR